MFPENDSNTSGDSDDFVNQAFKKQRIEKGESAYIDTRFITPTSNDVERLFSLAKRTYADNRKSMTVRTLESLLFLKANRDHWDINLVADAIKNSEEDLDSESDNENDSN